MLAHRKQTEKLLLSAVCACVRHRINACFLLLTSNDFDVFAVDARSVRLCVGFSFISFHVFMRFAEICILWDKLQLFLHCISSSFVYIVL